MLEDADELDDLGRKKLRSEGEDMEMAEHDAEVGDGFFDSEDDDAPVDMAVVYEGMKHVPLPDFDYAERVVAGSAAAAEATEVSQSSEPATVKDLIPGGSGFEDAGQGKKKGASRARSLKRVKLSGTATATDEKAFLKTSAKGGGNRIATAAKVAAKVAPNVVTGGVVAEAGPRPDFSLWTVEDDLLLENAMEAGAAVEALAKGAMRFSHRFTVRELRERWRALLYDPELSAEASARMVEAEAALSDLPPKVGGTHDRHAKHLEHKRRENSIRSLYHKRKRPQAEEKLVSATESQTLDEGVFRETGVKCEEVREKSVVAPLNTMTLGNVDPALLEGLLSPKGGATDFDCTFTQMVSLLAAGGVGAVVGALPGIPNLEIVEDQKREQEIKCEEPVTEADIVAPKREDVGTDQCQSQTPVMLGGNDEPNIASRVDSVMEEVLQPPSVQSDKEIHVVEGEGIRQISTDRNVSGNEGCKEAAIPVGNREWKPKDTGDLTVPRPPIQATTSSPVTKECLVSETAPTEVAGILTATKTEELSCSMLLDADPSVEHAEQLGHPRIVKAETAADTTDIGCAPGVEALQPHHALQERNQVASNFRDEIVVEDYSGSHVHWKHGDMTNDIEQEQEQELERYQDQEQNLESDQDFDSDQQLSYIGSDYDGEYYENEGDEVRAGVEFTYASDSPETLLDHDLSSEYVQAGPTNDIMIDPILGPVVCTLSTEDTEIPDLYDVLPLPVLETSLIYNSDGELRGNYLLDCTSPDDEADVPSSPSEFHVYEEWESSDALRNQVHAPRYEDDNIWDSEMSAGKQGRTFPQSCAQPLLAGNLSPNVYCSRPVKDEGPSLSDFDGENQLIQFPVLQLHDGEVQRASSDTAGTFSSTALHIQGHSVPAEGDGDFYHEDIDPLSGQEVLVRVDPETGVLRSDEETSALEIAEEELESEAETRFSDVENMILNMDLDPGEDDEFSALEESKRMYRRQRRMLVRLEQNFSSAMQRSLTKRKALAILYGRNLLYYMTKTEVLMGRMTQDNVVDIDLGKEGRANKVSRQQASLKLKEDGCFYLRNLGRRTLTVNNIPVDSEQRAMLGSNCLIEVGGMCFIFEINKRLVKQQMDIMRRDL